MTINSPPTTVTVAGAPAPPAPGNLNQIQVTPSNSAPQAGQNDTITAKAVDQYGKVMPGITLYLWSALLGTAYSMKQSAPTDANGIATWTVTFASAGSYNIVVSGDPSSATSPVPSNTVSLLVTAAPPPPQSKFQLVPGTKVKVPLPAGVSNMGLQITNIYDIGAPRFSTTVIIGGIGRSVTFGGLSYAPIDFNKSSYVGTGIRYKVVVQSGIDAYGNDATVGVAQSAGNDGACYVQADVDGNYLSLTFFDSLGTVLEKITGIRPGNQYDNYGKFMAWGGGISVNLIDMDQWAAWAPSYSATYFEQVTPSNYGSYKVIASTIQLVLPAPVLQITDKGLDPSVTNAAASGTHLIHVDFFDSTTGSPLQAVANALAFGYTSGGTTTFSYQIPASGGADFSISSGSGFSVGVYAFVGGESGVDTPYTPNTIISNVVTLS